MNWNLHPLGCAASRGREFVKEREASHPPPVQCIPVQYYIHSSCAHSLKVVVVWPVLISPPRSTKANVLDMGTADRSGLRHPSQLPMLAATHEWTVCHDIWRQATGSDICTHWSEGIMASIHAGDMMRHLNFYGVDVGISDQPAHRHRIDTTILAIGHWSTPPNAVQHVEADAKTEAHYV